MKDLKREKDRESLPREIPYTGNILAETFSEFDQQQYSGPVARLVSHYDSVLRYLMPDGQIVSIDITKNPTKQNLKPNSLETELAKNKLNSLSL